MFFVAGFSASRKSELHKIREFAFSELKEYSTYQDHRKVFKAGYLENQGTNVSREGNQWANLPSRPLGLPQQWRKTFNFCPIGLSEN